MEHSKITRGKLYADRASAMSRAEEYMKSKSFYKAAEIYASFGDKDSMLLCAKAAQAEGMFTVAAGVLRKMDENETAEMLLRVVDMCRLQTRGP